MTRSGARAEARVAEALAQVILKNGDSLEGLQLTDVHISPGRSHVGALYAIWNPAIDANALQERVETLLPLLRTQLGRLLRWRRVPTLSLTLDERPPEQRHLESQLTHSHPKS